MLPFPLSQCHQCKKTKYILTKTQTLYLMCTGREQKYYPQPQLNCPVHHPLTRHHIVSEYQDLTFYSTQTLFVDSMLSSLFHKSFESTDSFSERPSTLPSNALIFKSTFFSYNSSFLEPLTTSKSRCIWPLLFEHSLSLWTVPNSCPTSSSNNAFYLIYTPSKRPLIPQEFPFGRLITGELHKSSRIKIEE